MLNKCWDFPLLSCFTCSRFVWEEKIIEPWELLYSDCDIDPGNGICLLQLQDTRNKKYKYLIVF